MSEITLPVNARARRQTMVAVRILTGRRIGEEVQMPLHHAEAAALAGTIKRLDVPDEPEKAPGGDKKGKS